MPISVRYSFTQNFAVSAQEAFDWCTSFDTKDHTLMRQDNAKRQITQIAKGMLIVEDTFHTSVGTIEKQKLVHLYPDRLSWISTHLTGPNKHSQFQYEIAPQSKNASILNYTALHIEYEEKADAALLAERLCKEDAATWKLLAKAMTEELGK